ncbi:MAG: hypothetical protein H7144_10820 [Burkholderiales bacterium]|nr:hypothetical protein [Phycisphaerae bacterium]
MKSKQHSEFQTLEPRRLMAAVPLGGSTVNFGTGTQLRITGTVNTDTIVLSYDGASYNLSTGTGYSRAFSGSFNSIRITGGKGNDSITIDSSVTIPAYLLGEDGNDRLYGGSGNDNLTGGAGNDTLTGNAGRDTLITVGGGTSDVSNGGEDSDFFWVDPNVTEVIDADSAEISARAVNRISAFETSKFVTGTKTQAITKEIGFQRFRDPDATAKSYVYKKFDANPLFATGGPTADDVKQGQIGDCYFLATLAGAADVNPNTIRTMIADFGDGTYGVRLHNGTGTAKFFRVDGDLATSSTLSVSPVYAKLGAEKSLWVAVAEKAFAYQRRMQGSYKSINGGWMTEVFTAIGATGHASKTKTATADAGAFIDWVENKLAGGDVVTLGILTYSGQLNLVNGHAYTVDRVETLPDGTKQLVIRNPWAVDGNRTDDGVNDGYVTLSASQTFGSIDTFVSARAA